MQNIQKLYQKHVQQLQIKISKFIQKSNKYDSIVLHSGLEKKIYLDDQSYPFKAHFNFKYLLPINLCNSFIVIRPNKRPVLILEKKNSVYEKNIDITKNNLTNEFDIEYFEETTDIKKITNLHNSIFLGEDIKTVKQLEIKKYNNQDLLKFLARSRTIKSEFEIECIKQANIIANKGHLAIADAIKQNSYSEFELNQIYLAATKQEQNSLQYNNIIAHNENAAILHYPYKESDAVAMPKSLLVDAGASYNQYCSDISRTYAYQQDIFAEMILAVTELKQNICNQIKTDCNWIELQQQNYIGIANILKDFKITTCSATSMFEEKNIKYFLPHSLGHSLGLQVHDVGMKEHFDYSKKPLLKTNMVLAIEPGVYFISHLLKKLKETKFKNSFNWCLIEQLIPYGGIRTEDNIQVLPNKSINITKENEIN